MYKYIYISYHIISYLQDEAARLQGKAFSMIFWKSNEKDKCHLVTYYD